MNPSGAHLAASTCIDSAHPAVIAFSRARTQGAIKRERALALCSAVNCRF
ncbi:MAG: hypothetical protein WEK74_04480 [Hydrogenophaga sp.]